LRERSAGHTFGGVAAEARHANNQALFREVNERIAELSGTWWAGQHLQIICECANTGCVERLDVPLAEYERVWAHSGWFLIRPGHAVPDVEQVIEQHEGTRSSRFDSRFNVGPSTRLQQLGRGHLPPMATDVMAITKARSMWIILLATCQRTLLAVDDVRDSA
jgi:hypothetical protein